MTVETYENVVIGSGEAGKYIAWTLAKKGQRTAVVEGSMVGGACPNVACLPSKNVIHSAKVASFMARSAELGMSWAGKVDMERIAHRKAQMVDDLRAVHLTNFKESGAELVMGQARFVAPRTVEVALSGGGARTLRGERVFLAVGTRASLPEVPGLADAVPLTHVEALRLERVPAHLVILGGGYVGLELAQAMRRFGSEVTVVQRGEQLLDREDPDVATAVLELMKAEGVHILLSAEARKVTGSSGVSVRVEVSSAAGKTLLEATDILVAAGRTPNTERLDLEKAGIERDARGYVRVNNRLETTAPGVWAMGECAGSPQFTHVSFDDFRVVRDNLAGGSKTTEHRIIPYCLFTDPELAHVGLSEREAQFSKISYRLAKVPAAAVLRTRTVSEPRGFLKALVADDDRVSGFTAFCTEASELLAAVQTAMIARLPYEALRDGIFAHPTMAEGLTVLFARVPARARDRTNLLGEQPTD